jgi:hypothetical protein
VKYVDPQAPPAGYASWLEFALDNPGTPTPQPSEVNP